MLTLKIPIILNPRDGLLIFCSAPYGASVNPVGADVHDARALDKKYRYNSFSFLFSSNRLHRRCPDSYIVHILYSYIIMCPPG